MTRVPWKYLLIPAAVLGLLIMAAVAYAVKGTSTPGTSITQASVPGPSIMPSDAPGNLQARTWNWDQPFGSGDSSTTVAEASSQLAFTPVVPPSSLGAADQVYINSAEPRATRGIAWLFHPNGNTVQVIEQPVQETEADLENSITCTQEEVAMGCISAGRGLTTLSDGTTAVWIHYPYGTSVEWHTSSGVDIAVAGSYSTLTTDQALSMANSIESAS